MSAIDLFSASEPCTYEGSCKVVNHDGHCSPLLCQAHAEEWLRQLRASHIVRPRIFPPGATYVCKANWPFAGAVPG